MEEQQRLVLTDETIDILNTRGLWMISKENIEESEVLLLLPRRFKAVIWADLKGGWGLESISSRKSLSLRQFQKALTYLIKHDYIQPADWQVFPEFTGRPVFPEELVPIIMEEEEDEKIIYNK